MLKSNPNMSIILELENQIAILYRCIIDSSITSINYKIMKKEFINLNIISVLFIRISQFYRLKYLDKLDNFL